MQKMKLIDLKEKLEKLIELRKYARLYGGNINLGDEIVTEIDLNNAINEVRAEIHRREFSLKHNLSMN